MNSSMKKSITCIWIAWIFLLSNLKFSVAEDKPCPVVCAVCFKDHLSCTKGGLTYIPRNIYQATTKITLIGHQFTNPILSRSNFSIFAKTKYFIKQLSIRQSHIEILQPNTFYDLSGLDNLDLSENKKIVVRKMAFSNLKLKHLKLDDIQTLELSKGSFDNLLVSSLSMKNSRLKTLAFDILKPISDKLKNLFLTNNQLSYLQPGFRNLFSKLMRLELSGNPLQCTCDLAWLGQTLAARIGRSKPSLNTFSMKEAFSEYPRCSGPSHVRNKLVHNVTEAEFSCTPPTLELIDIYFEKSNLVRLSCSAKMAAEKAPIQIVWQEISKQNTISYPTLESISSHKAVTLVQRNPRIASYRCLAKSSAGNATIKLKINWPTKPDPNYTNYNNNNPNDKNKSNNKWNLNTIDKDKNPSKKFIFKEQFTLLEMLGAVLGTFIITLIIFLLLYKFCFKRTHKTLSDKPPHHHLSKKQPGYTIYETAVYSDSQTYDVPQNTTYPNYNQALLNKTLPVSTPTHFIDYRTQQKISHH